MRLAFCISPTIGPPSSLSPLAHPNKRPVPEKIHPPDPRPTSDPHRTSLSLSLSHPRGPRSLGRDHSQHQCCLPPAFFFSHHIQRNDGDTDSLAELLSASAEERAILDSIDVAPSRPPGPSQVHRQPALLLFRQRCVQNQICRFSHPPARSSGRMIYSKIDSIVEFKHASRRVSLPFACRWRRKFLHPFWPLPSRFRVLPQN